MDSKVVRLSLIELPNDFETSSGVSKVCLSARNTYVIYNNYTKERLYNKVTLRSFRKHL